jgi:hypothetical protein
MDYHQTEESRFLRDQRHILQDLRDCLAECEKNVLALEASVFQLDHSDRLRGEKREKVKNAALDQCDAIAGSFEAFRNKVMRATRSTHDKPKQGQLTAASAIAYFDLATFRNWMARHSILGTKKLMYEEIYDIRVIQFAPVKENFYEQLQKLEKHAPGQVTDAYYAYTSDTNTLRD